LCSNFNSTNHYCFSNVGVFSRIVFVRLVVKLLNLTMSDPSPSKQERGTREYCASELSKNVGKVKFETCVYSK